MIAATPATATTASAVVILISRPVTAAAREPVGGDPRAVTVYRRMQVQPHDRGDAAMDFHRYRIIV